MTADPSSPVLPASPAAAGRLHALDHLRATMMWLGIVLHASIAYMAAPSPLPWHDDLSTPVADLLVAVIHAFRMPLFFILAGFFVALLLQQRGLAGMPRHRVRRLGLPTVGAVRDFDGDNAGALLARLGDGGRARIGP